MRMIGECARPGGLQPHALDGARSAHSQTKIECHGIWRARTRCHVRDRVVIAPRHLLVRSVERAACEERMRRDEARIAHGGLALTIGIVA
jgi:hypothetical protein